MTDNEARARDIGYEIRGDLLSADEIAMVAAVLDAAEARGRVAGLREAQMLLLGRGAGSAYREIDARLAALAPAPAKETKP